MASFNAASSCTTQHSELANIIRVINHEFGFNIPFVVDIRKLRPHELSDEERCQLRIRPLVGGWNSIPAVYQCIERLRKLRQRDPKLTRPELLRSLENFLVRTTKDMTNAGPESNAVQSFGPTIPQQSLQDSAAGIRYFDQDADALYTSDTEVAASEDEAAAPIASTKTKIASFSDQGIREHWQSHRLPRGGLFVSTMENCPELLKAPFAVRYECTRLATAYGLDLVNIDILYAQLLKHKNPKLQRVNSGPPKTPSPWRDLSTLHKNLRNLATDPQPQVASSEAAWRATLNCSPHVNLSARLMFDSGSKTSSAMFKLRLSPLITQPRSKRLFRKFGASRFIAIKIPSFKSAPSHLSTADNPLRMRLLEWLGTPHGKSFAGNHWSFLHLQPIKDRRRRQNKSFNGAEDAYEALFFATRGPGLEDISIKNLISWFMPLELNLASTFAKAYARLELGLSNTYPTIEFTPDQVHYVRDQYGDSTPEDSRFNNPRYDFADVFDPENPKIMNDGCSRISFDAAKEAWSLVAPTDNLPIPSVFQARIGPAKGLWMVENPGHIFDKTYGRIWIEITHSQKKFLPHEDDLSWTNRPHDPHRLTFDVVSWSQPRSSSKLYKGFCPIMEDCGVPRSALEERMSKSLLQEQRVVKEALETPELLIRWLQGLEGVPVNRESDEWPIKDADKIRTMINAGFDLRHSSYLTDLCSRVILRHLSQVCVNLHAESQCSVYVPGVADPYKCLNPGEIHMYFSESIVLPNGRKGTVINDINALVARNPALRPSDMQKVRLVFRPELAHLIDVAVFPTRGATPLASKLQGGDYDGDDFWLCWEPDIVRNFRNKPVQSSEPDAAALGIRQDRRTLGDVLEDGGLTRFLVEGASLQLHDQLLGLATNTHTRITYIQNKLQSGGIDALTDLHDLLVDSSKNGYVFERPDFDAFILKHFPGINRQQLADPAWKRIAADESESMCIVKYIQKVYNKNNIIDHLVFEVAQPLGSEIYRSLLDKMQAAVTEEDEDLARPYESMLISVNTPALLKQVLENLLKDLRGMTTDCLNLSWCRDADSMMERNKRYKSEFSKLRLVFQRLQPRCTALDPSIDQLLHVLTMPTSRASPSAWDQLKASAFWCSRRGKSVYPVFEVCGKLLCYIKAHSGTTGMTSSGEWQSVMPVYVTPAIMNGMKMRRVKNKLRLTGLEMDEDAEVDDDEGQAGEEVEAMDVDMVDVDLAMHPIEDQFGWTAHGMTAEPDSGVETYYDARNGLEDLPKSDRTSLNVLDELSQMFGSSLSRLSGRPGRP